MSISLTDQPSHIFKLFEFLQLTEEFERHQALSETRSIEETVPQGLDEECKLSYSGEIGLEKGVVSSPLEILGETAHAVEVVDSKQEAEEPAAIEEQAIINFLELLSRELIPDDEMSRLPADAIKDVFPYFMRANFQMPDIDETPLGCFLLQKKEEQIEDLTRYELEQMLSFTLKENKMLHIQNDVFRRFLKKNDPRYNDGNVSVWEPPNPDDREEDVPLDVSTAEMAESKVIFPDVEDSDSEGLYRAVLSLYTRVVEHEIKSVHKEYEIELNEFAAKMKDLSSIKNSLNIHRDKVRETSSLLRLMIVKKQSKKKNKVIFNPHQFAEFLKAAIRQDQQDLRRFRVMIYEHKRKFVNIQRKVKSRDAIRRVDLELYEIKAKQLSSKLSEMNEEFLQLKKIFDSYQKRLDKFQKRIEISRKMLLQNQKTYLKKVRDLEVQHTCYKMAFESISEVIRLVTSLHSSVLQRKNIADGALQNSEGNETM